ncbi:recombinase RecF [candidate division WOR-3 bacterium]|uniref:Recombinase RecF n=1 Tax=candidate division WOR-3 bacterium TaxID=2052148 RepID=A0A660SFQ1_UNCW3|nr:MAG: recombinase RecF [candidate division WOR-3 bacterium]
MLWRVKIERYKSFKTLEINLKPVTVIIGPNASGKSNFLDALYFISRAVTSKNLKEAFEDHRGLPLETFFYGDEGFERMISKSCLSCLFEIDVELSDSTINEVNRLVREKRSGLEKGSQVRGMVKERYLRYRLVIEMLPKTGHLRVIDEALYALRSNGEIKRSRSPFLERKKNHFVLRMEHKAHPIHFQVGLDYTIVSTPLYEPHYPHVVALKKELERWCIYYLEPRALMREDVPISEIERIGSRGENLAAFINTLKQRYPDEFRNLNLTLQKLIPRHPQVDVRMMKEGRLTLLISENGLSFSSRLISEGTLRVLGLIAAIHPRNSLTLIGFEEPENGVHPPRLRMIADLLKNVAQFHQKQVIITTHSPLFAEHFDDGDLMVCEKKDNYSLLKPFSSYGPLYRRRNILSALSDCMIRGDLGG